MVVYESSMFSLQELLCYDIKDKLSLCRKIASGISYIHECNIIHKNLCPKNIVISTDFTPKITGFEMSRETSQHTRAFNTDHIDIKYWSPERKEGKGSSKASDVYAFGMIMCDIMQTIPPSLEDCLSDNRPPIEKVLLELIKLETLQ
ncbi:hypothetical protein G6F27_013991 [Rhizopus arrhizus]|nr:hypothetical protein G6F27_013991 [Rhizopus arrhizus]